MDKKTDGYEIADIIRTFQKQLPPQSLTVQHKRTLFALARCRTAALGGHIDQCNECGHLRISYNSCRNRHCPKCQGLQKEAWIIQQENMLLPVAYFHVVFTLPHQLNALCLINQRSLYDLLFKAVWHTIKTLANDPQWVGVKKTGATMVLHTWGQNLSLHPHLHCIVPNGGIDKNGNWCFPKKSKDNFLFPVIAMQKVFKGFFMQKLLRFIKNKKLNLSADFPAILNSSNFYQWKNTLYKLDWVVFTKKPFSGVKQVISYLGRYSHRVAITNRRILNIDKGRVFFSFKDYKDQAKKKIMSLSGRDFLKRFCLHILPPRFRKIRAFGIFSNASKAKSIAIARKALNAKHQQLLTRAQRKELAVKRLFKKEMNQCPCCQKGKMKTILMLPPNKAPPDYIIQLMKLI